MSDFMMDKNKAFDDKLLNKEYTSRSDAYKMLALESTKKHNGNVLRQFRKVRTAFQTHVVCVTDKDVLSLADCKCSYRAVIKKKRKKDDNNLYYSRRFIGEKALFCIGILAYFYLGWLWECEGDKYTRST